MIVATVFIHGHPQGQVNWSSWKFAQLPSAGDLIGIAWGERTHYATVRYVEHQPVRFDQDGEPEIFVVTDYKSSFDA